MGVSRTGIYVYIDASRINRPADRDHAKDSVVFFAYKHHLTIKDDTWKEFRNAYCEDGTLVSGFMVEIAE